MPHVTHLECANCGAKYEAGKIHNLCTACHRPLWVKYDLDAVKDNFTKQDLAGMEPTLWRYMAMLPLEDPANIVSLIETVTPILPVDRLAAEFGVKHLMMKDESRLPTGSFKARGMTMAISMAKELGIQRVAVPTAGNAGGAMAFYAARAGMEAYVLMPEDTPIINQKECWLAGAKTFLVNGLIDDCGKIIGDGVKEMDWFNVSTLKEPYRIEGKKTMGLEVAEQFDWELPDVILYPTGGGTGLIGMWKAFGELEAMGWLKSSKKPKMISCQSDGCEPIARAFRQGQRFAKKHEGAETTASGIRVPLAVGDFMILDAVNESGGVAISTPEKDIQKWMELACSTEGISLCPETAICLGALDALLKDGTVKATDKILIFNTGAAQKYPHSVNEILSYIDINQPVNWDDIRSGKGVTRKGEQTERTAD
ncbi:MAG: threonine synthase [Candidatus Binatia bacterium]|jgi:threonine synthase